MRDVVHLDKRKLPDDWKWVKLKAIAESIQYGYTESSSKEKIGPKFLRITDIQENRVEWDKVPYCKIDEDSKRKYLLEDGDLVFARTGATVGKSFLIKGEIPESVFASYLIRVRVNKDIDEKYLANFFQSTIYWSQITDGQVGIGQPNVNGTKLGQLNVPLAPKDEQQQIVSKIEELFSELDKGIEELKTAQQQLKVYQQAVLKWAFEGKLTKSKAEWKKIRLGDVALAVDPHPSHRTPPKVEKGVPYVSTKDFNYEHDKIDFSNARIVSSAVLDEHLERYKLEQGDFVIGKIGTIGKPVRIVLPQNYTLSANIVLIQPRKIDRTYLYYFFQSDFIEREFKAGAKATTQAAFGIQKVRELNIHLPSEKEQYQIVQEIESRLSVCDKIEETITDSLKQAEALRQSILKAAFNGKLAQIDNQNQLYE